MIVALDTMILIWGIRRGGKPSQRQLEQRAKILLRQLEDDRAQIVVPSIVIAELLVPVLPANHGAFIIELQRRFLCPPFDVHAASLAAQLWQLNHTAKPAERLGRRTLKADVQIVAAAKVAGATRFCSNDRKCRRLAEQLSLTALDLPTHHEDMFVDHELRGSDGGSA